MILDLIESVFPSAHPFSSKHKQLDQQQHKQLSLKQHKQLKTQPQDSTHATGPMVQWANVPMENHCSTQWPNGWLKFALQKENFQ